MGKRWTALVAAIALVSVVCADGAGAQAGREPTPEQPPAADPSAESPEAVDLQLRRAIDVEQVDEDSGDLPLATLADPGVAASSQLSPMARTHSDVIGSSLAHTHGHDGQETRVVVIEGGFDLDHPALAGSTDPDLEACFVAADAPDPCPDDADADPNASIGDGSASNCDVVNCHVGTYAASLVLGRGGGGAPRGVAPAAELVPIRVIQTDADDGHEFVDPDDLLAALEYIEEIHPTSPVDVVSLSIIIETGPQCTSGFDAIADAIDRLAFQGITVVAPVGAGNVFPACHPSVLPVTATGSHDILPEWAGFGWLAAPGILVPGAVPGGSDAYSGTGVASSLVAGAVALGAQTGTVEGRGASYRWLLDAGVPAYGGDGAHRIDVAASLGLRPRSVYGFYAVSRNGEVWSRGSPPSLGDARSIPGTVGGAKPPLYAGGEYGIWTVTASGQVIGRGSLGTFGDMQGRHLNAPIVAMAATATGRGYWLLAEDGGVFTFGDARFYGSTGNMRLNAPVTDIAATPTGRGYWLTAKDGGVFSFGDARFFGSTGDMTLNQPVVSMDTTASGKGYWLVALDGGVFTFGDARFHGSLPGLGVANETGYRVRAIPDGDGYYISTLEGGVYPFGSATFFGHLEAWYPSQHVMEIVLVDGGEPPVP